MSNYGLPRRRRLLAVTGKVGRHYHSDLQIKTAFTLAEVLITLVIIGIIAAITVPMIHANYKKQETVSKLKKAYSTLSQAINRSEIENGTSKEWKENSNNNAKNLFDTYIRPYLLHHSRDKKMYAADNPYKYLNGTESSLSVGAMGPNRASFLLSNGIFIMIATSANDDPRIYIDINGSKKPNTHGKDVFALELHKEKGLIPLCKERPNSAVYSSCSRTESGVCCLERIMRDGWEINYPL